VKIRRNSWSLPIFELRSARAQRYLRCAIPAAAMVAVVAISGVYGGQAVAGAAAFTVSSPDLSSGSFDKKFILNGFGCTGSNVSPAIQWSNVPAGTKSLALQVQDKDAPTESGFWHWTVYNIPATYALSVPDLEAAGGIPKTGTATLHSFVLNKGLGDKVLGKASFVATYGR
jgi:hypothetical protein